jgi:hypothetical protein
MSGGPGKGHWPVGANDAHEVLLTESNCVYSSYSDAKQRGRLQDRPELGRDLALMLLESTHVATRRGLSSD